MKSAVRVGQSAYWPMAVMTCWSSPSIWPVGSHAMALKSAASAACVSSSRVIARCRVVCSTAAQPFSFCVSTRKAHRIEGAVFVPVVQAKKHAARRPGDDHWRSDDWSLDQRPVEVAHRED